MIGRKFRVASFQAFGPGVWILFRSSLYLVYLISFLVVVLGLTGFSRLHIFGTCLVLFCLEWRHGACSTRFSPAVHRPGEY